MFRSRKIVMTLFAAILIVCACEKSSFMGNSDPNSHLAPSNLSYANILNAREFDEIKSNVPTINSGGIPCFYKVLSVRDTIAQLDDSYLDCVSIASAYFDTIYSEGIDENGDSVFFETPIIKPNNCGQITITENDKYAQGDYYFTIEATSHKNGDSLKTVFDDAFYLNVVPELPTKILYSPFSQNLVVGEDMSTTEAYVPMNDPDVTFVLTNHEDKLIVDSSTGAFSLNPSYTVTEPETVRPSLKLIINASQEEVSFESGFLDIVISNTPIDLPGRETFFFYPNLLYGNNTQFGYLKYTFNQEPLPNNKIWNNTNTLPPLALEERPDTITDNKSILMDNLAWGGGANSYPVDSWVVMNAQDISQYSYGYDVRAVYHYKQAEVRYLPSGATPSDLEVYITNSFTGDIATTEWTQVNEILKCKITDQEEEFIGTPYPGDNEGPDPDGKKDLTRVAHYKWVRCELDLSPYKDWTQFTLAFRYAPYHKQALNYKNGVGSRFGNYWISDVNYKATETEMD